MWTGEQTRRQMNAVSELLPTHAPRAIVNLWKKLVEIEKEKPGTLAEAPTVAVLIGVGLNRMIRLAARVTDQWNEEDPKTIAARRSRALRRLYKDAERARGAGNWSAVRAIEDLIAKMEGTLAPIVVDVNQRVTVALDTVIRSMSPEEMTRRLAARRELETKGKILDAMNKPRLPPAS